MPTTFEIDVPGATLVGERHDVGDHWSPHVDDAGRLPLVLLHAAVADRRSWQRVVPTWSTQRTVLTYDQRGFGESRWEATEWDPVADLFAVLDAQGVDRAVLVGNSMGGGLAMLAALRDPARVAGMVLLAPAFFGAPAPTNVPDAVLLADRAIDEAIEAGELDRANELELAFWLDGAMADRPRADPAARELFLEMNGRALAAPPTGPVVASGGVWDHLEQLAMPILLLYGEHDLPHGRSRCELARMRMPDATLVEVAGTGHLPALDAHQRTLAACADFLGRLA